MITISRPNQVEFAQAFARLVIDERGDIGRRIISFIERNPAHVSTSRVFDSLEQLGWGSGTGKFIDDLLHFAESGLQLSSAQQLMIWDNGYSRDDINAEDARIYEKSFLPELVQVIELQQWGAFQSTIEVALRRCNSFYPVGLLGAGEDQGKYLFQISAVIVSAFDQEGAIVFANYGDS